MSIESIISMFTGGGMADIEKNAGDLLARLEKLGADVVGSNGNVIAAVVSLASDFATIQATVSDLKAIVEDLRSFTTSTTAAANTASAAAATVVAAASVPGATPASPVPPPSTSLSSALATLATLTHTLAGADPFAAKPLAKAASVVEPKGGA